MIRTRRTVVSSGPYDALYDARIDHMLWGAAPGRLVARVREWIEPGASVLDAGCGDGKNALFLEGNGYECDGFDASDLALDGLANRFTAAGVTPMGSYVLATADEFDIEAGVKDCLVSYGFFHCLEVDTRVNVHRRLQSGVRDGGIMIFSALLNTVPMPPHHGTPAVTLASPVELEALLSGWTLLYSEYGVITEHHLPAVPEHQHNAAWLVAEKA